MINEILTTLLITLCIVVLGLAVIALFSWMKERDLKKQARIKGLYQDYLGSLDEHERMIS